MTVSIQLVSPASGDNPGDTVIKIVSPGFHSIGFPSEWGPTLIKTYALTGV